MQLKKSNITKDPLSLGGLFVNYLFLFTSQEDYVIEETFKFIFKSVVKRGLLNYPS